MLAGGEVSGDMPAGLVHQHDGVRAGRDGLGQLGEKAVHRFGVEVGHHRRRASVARRAAPMIQAERCPKSRRPRGVRPRCHQM